MILRNAISQLAGYRPKTIVHVGAHHAEELSEYQKLQPQTVVWIEPDRGAFDIMLDRLNQRQADSIRHVCVNALIGAVEGIEVPFFEFANSGASSSIFRSTALKREHYPGADETGKVTMLKTRTLESVLRQLDLRPEEVEVIVLDTQGSEILCLSGAGPYLEAAKFLEVEVSQDPLYEGAPLFPEVNGFLEARHFKAISFIPWHGDVIYANTRFLRVDPNRMHTAPPSGPPPG